MPTLASDFGSGQVFLSLLEFVLFFIWIWLLIVVFSDLFRSHDLSGWAKALWIIGIIILPYLGVLLYLIVRGHKMAQHVEQAAPRARCRGEGLHPGRGGNRRRDTAAELASSPSSRSRACSTMRSSRRPRPRS